MIDYRAYKCINRKEGRPVQKCMPVNIVLLGHFSFLKTVFHTIYIALACLSPPKGHIIVSFRGKTRRLMGFFQIDSTIPAPQFSLQLDLAHALRLTGFVLSKH